MAWLFILFVVLIGAGLPLQALVNARLGVLTSGSIFASSLSILVSMIVAVVFLLLHLM